MTTAALPNKSKLYAYWQLLRFDRPVGIELVLWSALWAVFLAAAGFGQLPAWHIVVVFAVVDVVVVFGVERKVSGG